jgi:hypothetical protein
VLTGRLRATTSGWSTGGPTRRGLWKTVVRTSQFCSLHKNSLLFSHRALPYTSQTKERPFSPSHPFPILLVVKWPALTKRHAPRCVSSFSFLFQHENLVFYDCCTDLSRPLSLPVFGFSFGGGVLKLPRYLPQKKGGTVRPLKVSSNQLTSAYC